MTELVFCIVCRHNHIPAEVCLDECVICQIEAADREMEPVEKEEDTEPNPSTIPAASTNPVRGKRNRAVKDPTKPRRGRITEQREMSLEAPRMTYIMFVNPRENSDAVGVTVALRVPGRKYPTQIGLTGMTEPELLALAEFWRLAIARALPLVRKYDAQAKEAFENGDYNADSRLYRPVPKVIVSKRAVEEHAEGVSLGCDGPLRGSPYIELAYDRSTIKGPSPRLVDTIDPSVLERGTGVGDGDVPDGEPDGLESGDSES